MDEPIRATRPEPPPHVSADVEIAATPVPKWAIGEFFGTFILVFFGCGGICSGVVTGAPAGVLQIGLVFGIGIATAIYLTGSLSSAHLNPAVTIASAAWSRFPGRLVLPYIGVQLLGAFAAAAVLYAIFGGSIRAYETKHHIVRGEVGSEATAMVFGEYFPNPGGAPLTDAERETLTPGAAFATEVIATAILLLVIFCCTDERNANRPQILTAATIGLTITILMCLFSPLTMACLNPARDLGPRLFSAIAGWKTVPFTTNGFGWITVYLIAPIIGGLLGGGIYRVFFRVAYRAA
ncbi:MAG: MIP family channel protein [Verrucomicrobiota bacterium]|nr:MIP family channel protein [Verrucomicrobiota bacterium]